MFTESKMFLIELKFLLRTDGQNELECLPNQKSFINWSESYIMLRTEGQNKLECLPNQKSFIKWAEVTFFVENK